jgi:magnesium-transporting ATPase (P-type)
MTVSDVKCAKEEGNDEASEACFQQLYKAIALNTTAELDGDGKGIGNPTETALLRWTKERGADYADLRQRATITKRWPFSTERKYMATIADHTLYVREHQKSFFQCAGSQRINGQRLGAHLVIISIVPCVPWPLP